MGGKAPGREEAKGKSLMEVVAAGENGDLDRPVFIFLFRHLLETELQALTLSHELQHPIGPLA